MNRQPMRRRIAQHLVALAVAGAAAAAASGAAAGPYSDLVIFGDSISDTGNVRALTTALGLPSFPSFPAALGRFSDGPSWSEHLAAGLGLPGAANPSYRSFLFGTLPVPAGNLTPAGNNYAFGGARTDTTGRFDPLPTGLFAQFSLWSTDNGGAADPNALYVVLAGANDLRGALDNFSGNTQADINARAAAAQTVANISTVVGGLLAAGAQHILLANLPDLGLAPESVALNRQAAATEITGEFNQRIAQVNSFFDVFAGIDLDIRLLDFHSLAEAVVDDATNNGGATYGITNVTSPCIERGPFSQQFFFPDASDADGNCPSSLFSDDLHPSAAAHALLAREALRLVPAPASTLLVALAGLALLGVRRRA